MGQEQSHRRVLIVDDDDELRARCASTAGGCGWLADVATADTAIAQVARAHYSVVVVALTACTPDGARVIEALAAAHPATIFIATGRPDELGEGPLAHGELEIASLLRKPFLPDQLIAALDDALELCGRRRRHRATQFEHASVLLVEDNPGDADLVSDYLAEICGAVVTPATRVEDAVRALTFHRYDFVITDLTLPDARGLDAVRRLQPLAPEAPFVVLTGIDDEELALEAVKQGAQDYLVKGRIDAISLRRTLSHARERKQTWNRLREQTRHDGLTGVANRAGLRDRIEGALARAQRRGVAFAVMYIDLDRFKAINDTCGHDVGDAVLREVAERLRQAVRTTDEVARLGGDEFAVLLDDLWPDSRPLEVAARILDALAQPIVVASEPLAVTASIGLVCYPDVTGNVDGWGPPPAGNAAEWQRGMVDELLKAADSAMYLAKGRGRNNVQVYGAVSESERTQRAHVAELAHVLERDELSLHFQPQLTIDGGRVVAVEALLRWRRATGEWVPPAQFIPLLEESGRIVEVGAWVLERACEQLARWRADGWALRVSVNLSARQLEDRGLVEHVRQALQRHAVPADCLELELTESMLMLDASRAVAVLAELRALGVRLAIDDFGTGYSSLAYLSRFAVDCLKIDRSFIDGVDRDRERAVITSAIITLGHHLGLEVVAEGVETPEQLAFLAAAKCDLVQGYLLGRPAEASQLVLKRSSGRATTGRLPLLKSVPAA